MTGARNTVHLTRDGVSVVLGSKNEVERVTRYHLEG